MAPVETRPIVISCAALLCAGVVVLRTADTTAQNLELRAPSTFGDITDPTARSKALFTEAAKVIMNPRCANCHPAGDRPLQDDDQHPHFPPVARGAIGGGVPGNSCRGCHMDHNFPIVGGTGTYQSIPGHPRWGLAPIEMAWEGKSIGEICTQLKDPSRNGGRDLALLQEHLSKDDLIAWGWNPGPGRDPVPGTQARLGELIQGWIDSSAHCP